MARRRIYHASYSPRECAGWCDFSPLLPRGCVCVCVCACVCVLGKLEPSRVFRPVRYFGFFFPNCVCCMCVCVHVCACVCMCVCVFCVCVCVCGYMQTLYVHTTHETHTHLCISNVCVCVCMHVCVSVHVSMCVYVCRDYGVSVFAYHCGVSCDRKTYGC